VTNGTIFPEEAAKDLWPHFKKVCVNISVDGLGRQFDYQRFGANWEKVSANIERYRNTSSVTLVHVYVSISIFTAYYLPEIFAHWAKLGVMNFVSFVAQPDRFDVRSLPKELKAKISAKFLAHRNELPELSRSYLDQVDAYMNSEDREGLWAKAIESIWFHDGYRKQSFAATFPEFHREAMNLDLWWDYATQKERFFSS
jgi:sulfatase maturation enzyme AslB (radical SAM superfamily)